MGSTGDSPVPVGDSPTGRVRRLLTKDPSSFPPGALPVPPGNSPGGTGQWPVLPKNEFPDTLEGFISPEDSWLGNPQAPRSVAQASELPLRMERRSGAAARSTDLVS